MKKKRWQVVDDWHAFRTAPDRFDCSPSHQINARDQFIPLPKHCHLIAGEFGIVSNEMKPSSICLGDYEAIERVAMEGPEQGQRKNVFERASVR